jgi:hypothetical protein
VNRGRSVQRQGFKIPAQRSGFVCRDCRVADAYLLAHWAELFAQAEASPIVQNLRSREYLTEREVERLIEAAKQNRSGHRDAAAILVAPTATASEPRSMSYLRLGAAAVHLRLGAAAVQCAGRGV